MILAQCVLSFKEIGKGGCRKVSGLHSERCLEDAVRLDLSVHCDGSIRI
jgi:hypothetical protein